VQQADPAIMTALYWIALLLTVGLFAYLLYAMLRTEDF
jgi:K+-transporting ATPase KdpF subunit